MNPGQGILLVTKDLKVVRNFIWAAYTKWYHLGVELELDPSDLEAIRTKFNNDPAECFNQVLLDWLMGQGSACTWKNLAIALGAPLVKFSSLSEAIERKYCETGQTGAQPSGSNSQTELNTTNIEALFPYLSKDMPDHIRTNLIFRLQKDTDDIVKNFIALEIQLRRALIRSEAIANEIIPIIARKNHKYSKIFKDSDTIDKLLDEAEKHWSFFDYDLIELLILCLFEDEQHHLKVLLKEYAASFEKYARRRICECPSNIFEDEKKNGKVVVFKIEECNFEAMTVDELKKLCSRLNSAIGSYKLRLLKTDPGCVQLTFRALPSADEMIQKLTRKEQQALRNMGVLSITYGEQILNLVSPSEEIAEHEEATKKSISDLTVEVTESEGENSDSSDTNPPSPTLSLEEPMAALQVKDYDDDDDSAFGTISDITRTSVATRSTYGGSIVTSGLGTDISDESKDNRGRDLDDPRLDMLDSAHTTTEHNQQLHHAAKQGNLEQVKHLITKGLNPLTKDKRGDTVLHVAADYGRLEVLKYQVHCNPAPSGQLGTTPLHRAAQAGHLSTVKYLVENHQMDPLHQDEYGYSSLHRACQGGNLKTVKYLMEKMLQYMSIQDIFSDSTSHKTPMHVAALKGHIDIVKYLIKDCRCDPNLPNVKYGRGPLFDAAQEGHLSIVEFLIMECGCHPASRDNHQATPLHLAAKNGRLSTVRYLCEERKCDPLSTENDNRTPLHDAAHRGQSDVVDYLINVMHCSPNVPGWRGRRPLHAASQEGHLHLVINLVERHGCDPNSLDEDNVTPLHMAAKKGHLSIVNYLTQNKGCNSMCQDNNGDTPLHHASKNGYLAVVKHLIEHPPTIKNKLNVTPLQLALEKGHSEVVEYLLTKQ